MQIYTRYQWRNAKVKSDGSGCKGPTPCTCLCYRCCAIEQGIYKGMTLNGGPAGRAGWRAVFPIEKHEFSAGRRAALKGGPKQGGPASCTLGRSAQQSAPEGCTRRAGGLHIRAGCTTERAGGLQKNGGLHINTCRRAAEKGGPFNTRQTALKIITLAGFRRSSRCAKWRTVRCKGGLR